MKETRAGSRHFLALITILLLLIALLSVPVCVTADNFIGGLPLTTVQAGNVTGDLYIDATPPDWQGQGVSDLVKTFTLPETALGNITWARLYVSAYCGNMMVDRDIYILNQWDGDGVSGYEKVWNETGHAPFVYIYNGGNNNSAFLGHTTAEPYLMINGHETRVTSDYLMWYDVKDLIKNQTIFLNVRTAGSYDGRTKVATLVVAYNNPQSTTLTRYWVNEGHDVDSYYTENNLGEVAVGATTFETKGTGSFSSACLTISYMASHIGVFGFPGTANEQDPQVPSITFAQPLAAGAAIQGPYSGVMFWNVTSLVSGKSNATLGYARDVTQTGLSAFFKIPLAFLVLKSPLTAIADFSANVTSGSAPLAVQFIDNSTASPPSSWNWSFGDGISSTDRNPQHIFTSAGSYPVTLTVSNAAGSNTTVKQDYIVVNAPAAAPVASFKANVSSGSVPLTVAFSDTTLNSPTQWEWSFGDGNGSSLRNPVHCYTFAGNFTVVLNATNSFGSNTTSGDGPVTVYLVRHIPAANFSAEVTSGTAPLNIKFTDTSTNTPTSWHWDFGDGDATNATEKNPLHTFNTAGIYSVSLTVANNDGLNSVVKSDYITVQSSSGSPVAAFSATPLSGTAPLTVHFTDNSTGSLTGWTWDFGDGNSTDTTDQNPVHTYFSAGTYNVTLTACNENGSDNVTKTGFITVLPSNTGNTVISLSSPTQAVSVGGSATYQILADNLPNGISGYDLVVTLKNASVATITGVTYPSWGFSETITPLPNSSVKLSALDSGLTYQAGAKNVVLANITLSGLSDGMTQVAISNISMDPDGAGDAIATSVNNGKAIVGTYSGPIADFTTNVTSGAVPLAVKFTDASIGSPTVFGWDFNDDGLVDSTDKNPDVVTYTRPGKYSVNLTVSNAAGISDTTIKTNYITAESVAVPVIAFTGTPTTGTAPLTVTFTDKSSGSPTSWSWDFGDGNETNTTLQNPVHTYLSAGTYPVTLTATNGGGGNTSSLAGHIIVSSPPALGLPSASFTTNVTGGKAPLAVKFTDTSTGSPTSWSWDFGDGNASVLQNPVHTFPAGVYTSRLTVSNDVGSGTASRTITITTQSGLPGVAFRGTPTSGTAPLAVAFTDESSGSPTSWSWDFGDGNISNSENPTHQYAYPGSFSVSLTATNNAGSDSLTKSDYISATASATPPNLYVFSIVPNIGSVSGGNVFALEKNPVTINIKNSGKGASPETTVKLTSSDGFSGTGTVPAIAAGSSALVNVTDTTVRSMAGSSITYTAVVDPDNLVSESSESDNSKTTPSITTRYNGYKGKRYWTGGTDITTKHTFDINGSLVYSRGDSVYRSGSFGDNGWLSYTVNWDTSEFANIPSDATIKAAYLYVPYTWDNQNIAPDHTFIKFNGDTISRSNWYSDKSNFGTYADYAYGLMVYDVTSEFNKDGQNAAVFTRENPNYQDPAQAAVFTKISMYEFYLVVVYSDSEDPERLIYINEGFDLLGASNEYGTTEDEATAYVPFTGLTVPKSEVTSAKLITFVPSGDSREGNLLYNGNIIASNIWDYGGTGTGTSGVPEIAVDERSVTPYVASTNVVGIQGTAQNGSTPCMEAAQQILVITLNGGSDDSTSYSSSTVNPSAVVASSASTGVLTSVDKSGNPDSTDAAGPNIPLYSSSPSDGSSTKSQRAPSSRDEAGNKSSDRAGSPQNSMPWLPPALLITSVFIGATGIYGYKVGWIPGRIAPFRRVGSRIFCDGSDESASCRVIDSLTGTVSAANQKILQDIIPPNRGKFWSTRRLGIVLVIGLCILGVTAGFWLLSSPMFHRSTIGTTGGSFDLIPTIENIEDLDQTNHLPDYPAGFSARNGILLVYKGSEPHKIADLRITLTKGSVAVSLDTTTVPPATNAVGPDFTSYLEEEGNGNGILEKGEWLMVYADNGYDSSRSATEPKGKVLTWQPSGSSSVLEVPMKDSVDYRIEDTRTGSVLQEGTLLFVPAT